MSPTKPARGVGVETLARDLARDGREVQDRGIHLARPLDRPGPGEQPLAAGVTGAVGEQRGRGSRGQDPQAQLAEVGREQLLDLRGHAAREDQRAQPEAGGLQRAVEGGSARPAGSIGVEHVHGDVPDGHIVEGVCTPSCPCHSSVSG